MRGLLSIELVFNKLSGNSDAIDDVRDKLKPYFYGEFDNKVVFNVPQSWDGFRDGRLNEFLRKFDDGFYIALAYVSFDDDVVTQLDGASIKGFDMVLDGRRVIKYVKKKMRILNIIDRNRNTFEVKAFAVNLEAFPPVVTILDLYSSSPESGVHLSDFEPRVRG